ncbi:MAG: ParM/StbA family protein [Erysipelotrichaceae bacterium]|nr:ParM/StbA family protein [Erysipelotrichaceae bacterium]
MDTRKFKTKTEIINRSNGSIEGVFLVAVDYGYSGVKVFSQNCIGVFPNFAKRFDGELVGTPVPDRIVYKDLVTGERWLVGEAAQNDVSQDDTTISEKVISNRDRYDDPMFLVLVRTGLGIGFGRAEYNEPAGKPIYVQTGLPPKYMKSDTRKLVSAIAGHHRFSLQVGQTPERVFDFTIRKENVEVMPQPKGTLFSVAKDSLHRFIREASAYFRKNVLVIDGGFVTLDVFPIRNGRVAGEQTIENLSMQEVLKRTIGKINEAYDTDISLVGFQKCLGDGYVKIHDKFSSKNQSFGELLEASNREVCDEALETIGGLFHLYEYPYIIVTGGTGAAWNGMIREKLKGIEGLTIINGNQNDERLAFLFANVRGYYMFLYDKIQQEVGIQQKAGQTI